MAQVIVGENEGIESALRRFKRQVSRAGILQDVRKTVTLRRPSKRPVAKLAPAVSKAVSVVKSFGAGH